MWSRAGWPCHLASGSGHAGSDCQLWEWIRHPHKQIPGSTLGFSAEKQLLEGKQLSVVVPCCWMQSQSRIKAAFKEQSCTGCDKGLEQNKWSLFPFCGWFRSQGAVQPVLCTTSFCPSQGTDGSSHDLCESSTCLGKMKGTPGSPWHLSLAL